MIIIGITGTLGAGKGEIVNYLKTKGFTHYSAREFLLKEVRKRGLSENRDNTTMVADDLRKIHSPRYIIETLFELAQESGKDSVIESVRAIGEIEFLKKQKNFYLIAIDAPPEIRYERITKRRSSLDHVSYQKFLSDEEREMHSSDPTRGNISGVMKLADYVIYNEKGIENLQERIEEILKHISPK